MDASKAEAASSGGATAAWVDFLSGWLSRSDSDLVERTEDDGGSRPKTGWGRAGHRWFWRANLHSEHESSLRSMSDTPAGRLAPSNFQNQDNRQTRPAIASLALTGYDKISAGGLTCTVSMSQASGA